MIRLGCSLSVKEIIPYYAIFLREKKPAVPPLPSPLDIGISGKAWSLKCTKTGKTVANPPPVIGV